MRVFYDLLLTITVFAAGHGMFLAAALLVQKRANRETNFWLAALIVIFSLYIAEFAGYWSRFFLDNPHLLFITNSFPFLFGPLLLIYARRLLQPAFSLQKRQWLHFLPFLLYLLYLMPFYISPAEFKVDLLRNVIWSGETGFGPRFYLIRVLMVGHILAYTFYTIKAIQPKQDSIKDSLMQVKRSWTRRLCQAFAVIAILKFLQLGSIAFLHYNLIYQVDAIILSISAIMIFACGFTVVLVPVIFSGLPSVKAFPRYEKSALNRQDFERYVAELNRLMSEDRLYKKSDLKLIDLAYRLELPPHQLSQLLNQHMQQGFFDYINSHRVDAAKRMLQDPKKSHHTILSIAHEVGFNSKASFNASFKKITGFPPSYFRSSSQ